MEGTVEVVVVVEGEEEGVEEEDGEETKEEIEEEKQPTILTQVILSSVCLVRSARCWITGMTRGKGS